MKVRVVVQMSLVVVVVTPVAAAVLLVPADEVDVLLLGHISRASVRKDSAVGVEHWGGARGRRGRAADATASSSSVRRLVVEEEGAAPVGAAAIVEEGSRLAGDQDSPAAVLLLLPYLLELPQLLLLLLKLKLLLLSLVEGRRRDRGGRGRSSRAPRAVGRDRSNISSAVCASSSPLPIVIGLRRRSNIRKPGPPVFRLLLLLLLRRRLWRLALQPSNPRGRRGGGRGRCAAPAAAAAAAIHVPRCRLRRPTFISPLFSPLKKAFSFKRSLLLRNLLTGRRKSFFPLLLRTGWLPPPL